MNAPPIRLRWWPIVLAVVLYATLLQGVRPIYSPDEGRYTDVALVMLARGDWLHPMLNSEVQHWSKPPLTYWSIAASVGAFGRHEFAARLPGALAFAATILLVWRLGRRFVPRQPWLPALVHASFAFPVAASNLVTTDTLLVLWETLGMVAFVDLWWATDTAQARRARLLLGLALGLAFLTKGPPGLLPFAACLVFAFWSERWRGLRRAFGWDALLLFLLVGGSWYAVVAWQEPAVMRYFLVEEVVNRVASDKMHRNAQWYGALRVYLPTFLIGTLPWLPLLLRGAWRHRGDAFARLRADPPLRLLACWLLLPLAVFVLARSRLPLYVLPLFAPLALLAARELAPWTPRRWQLALLAAWCVVLVALRALPAWLDVDVDDRALARAIARELSPLPAEIAFVEDAPRFGLRFYLGSEIERLDLPDAPPRPQAQDLPSELREREGCRLLLVPPDRRVELEQALVAQRIGWRRIADVRGYAALAELSDDCAWRADARAMLGP